MNFTLDPQYILGLIAIMYTTDVAKPFIVDFVNRKRDAFATLTADGGSYVRLLVLFMGVVVGYGLSQSLGASALLGCTLAALADHTYSKYLSQLRTEVQEASTAVVPVTETKTGA